MVKKKTVGQEFIFLGQYLERLLNWKLWIEKAEELLAAMRSDGNSGHQTFHAASNPA